MLHHPWDDPGGSGRALAEWARQLRQREAELAARERALRLRRAEIERQRRELERRARRAGLGQRPLAPAAQAYFRQMRRRGPGIIGSWQATHVILACNVAAYLLDMLSGGRALLLAGAKYGPAIWAGEYYRLLTAAFLHVNLFHLLMNGYVIYLLGPVLERALGPARFVVLYLMGGLAGSAASLYFQPFGISVGASGAVFGLFGYLLFTRWRSPFSLPPALNQWLTTVLVLNLVITFLPGTRIDMWGHLGGLAGGLLAGFVVGLPTVRDWPLASGDRRLAGPAAAALVGFIGFLWLSVQPPF